MKKSKIANNPTYKSAKSIEKYSPTPAMYVSTSLSPRLFVLNSAISCVFGMMIFCEHRHYLQYDSCGYLLHNLLIKKPIGTERLDIIKKIYIVVKKHIGN